MPPKDITQTGPLTWRDLQKENQNTNNPSSYSIEKWEAAQSPRKIHIGVTEAEDAYYQNPVQWALDLEQAGYGESKYDIYTSPYHLEDLQENRALNQSGWEQLLNGVLKGAITTGTTFVNVLAGLPIGLAESITQGDVSRMWDNEVTNAMADVDDWAERELPNYYTREELENPWYQNIFTTNFLGDKLIKNFGFTFGAGAAGKVISKIPKLLPKLVTKAAGAAGRAERDIAAMGRATNAFSTSFLGAVGEGSIEALHASKEWSADMTNQINQQYQDKLFEIQNKYAGLAEAASAQYGNTEMGQSMLYSLNRDMQLEMMQAEQEKNNNMAQVASQRAQLGNAVLGFNLPILTLGNLMTLGKVYAKGYTAEMSSIGHHVKFHPEDLAQAGQTVTETGRRLTWRGLKTVEKQVEKQAFTANTTLGRNITKSIGQAAWEGTEEMLQAWASNTSKDYNTDYYNYSVDPDYTGETANMWKSLGDAFVQTFGDINNWEEFAIGMLSGGMSNMILGQTREMRRERQAVNETVNNLNQAVNTFNNRTMIMGINRHQALENAKIDAAIKGREKAYKDADFAQLASDVVTFASVGKLDELKAVVDYSLENMSDTELEQLSEDLKQNDETGEHNHFVNLDLAGKRQYLKDQQNKYHKVIDDYTQEYNEITALAGNRFTPTQLSELVYERLRARNAGERIDDLNKQIIEYLNSINTTLTEEQKASVQAVDAHSAILAAKQTRLAELETRLAEQQGKYSKSKRLKGSNLGKAIEKTQKQIEALEVDSSKDQLQLIKEYYNFIPSAINNFGDLLNFFKDNFNQFAQVTANSLYVTKNFTEEGVSDVRERMYLMQALTQAFTKTFEAQLPHSVSRASDKLFSDIQDMIALTADARYYNEKVDEFIQNPQKLEEKNEGIRERARNKINQKKADRVVSRLRNVSNHIRFNNVIQGLTPQVRDIVLKTLEGEHNTLATEFTQKNDLMRVASDYITASAEDELTKSQALTLLRKGINNLPVKSVTSVDNAIYSEDANPDLFADNKNYEKTIKLLTEALTKASDESTASTTSKDNAPHIEEDDVEIPEGKEDTGSVSEDVDEAARLAKNLETVDSIEKDFEGMDDLEEGAEDDDFKGLQGAEPVGKETSDEDFEGVAGAEPAEEAASEEGYFESAEDTSNPNDGELHVSTEQAKFEGTLVKVSTKDGVEKDSKKNTEMTEQKALEEADKKDSSSPATPSLREFDYEQIRVIDKENLSPEVKTSFEILYRYLKDDLKAFANIDNGLVKKGSIIRFGVYPKMDREITAAATNYNSFTVLLFVEDEQGNKHCVGHLASTSDKYKDIYKAVKEEFKGKLDTDEILYSKYGSVVDKMLAGFVKYDGDYRAATQEDFAIIRDRMKRDGQNANDVMPIITIAATTQDDGNSFTQAAGGKPIAYTGSNSSVSEIYKGKFYDGTAVIMMPTGAYDRTVSAYDQPEKAFVPVGIGRLKASNLVEDTKTYKEITALLKSLFKPGNDKGMTRGELKSKIGQLRSLLVLNYLRGENDLQEVHFDAATHKHDEDGNNIPEEFVEISETNPFWAKNGMTADDSQVLVLSIRNGNNKKFIPLRTGNVKESSPLSEAEIDRNVAELRDYLFNDLSAFVNIDRSKLTNPAYINKLIDDGIILINTSKETGLRVVSNTFTMKSFRDLSKNAPAETTTKTEGVITTTKPVQPTTTSDNTTYAGSRYAAFEPDDESQYRRTTYAKKNYKKADIDAEVSRVMKMLPQLTKDEVFKTLETLIEINDEGETAFGQFEKNIITLSKLAEVGTTYHEAFHLVFKSILNKDERKALLDEYKNLYPKGTSVYDLMENMAEDFREYCLTKEASVGKKVLNWFKHLYSLVFGYTQNKPVFDSIAKDIWRGKYADREVSATEETSPRIVDNITYEANGPVIHTSRGNFWIGDLSIDRFQRLTDAQINDLTYPAGRKTYEMNNRWGLMIDNWGREGVEIKGRKIKGKYVVNGVNILDEEVAYENERWQRYLQSQRNINPQDPFDVNKKCYV